MGQSVKHLNSSKNKVLRLIALMITCFFGVQMMAFSQSRIQAPVKIKIEDGDFEGVSVVLKNTTTGESNSFPGAAKLNLDLKLNCDYVISFTKPGYITKKIAFNSKAPADRATQGFYPFNFEVNLFKQYDGVNIVVFNQPVGKISYNRDIDDFDYDTDYTKQIQSALKEAEDEIKKKQAEEKNLAFQKKKEEEQKKADEAAKAKEDAKLKAEADKKAAAEAKAQAAADAKLKKEEEEKKKQEAAAFLAEEKKKQAAAKLEEEERAKAKAFEEQEAKKNGGSGSGSENPPKGGNSGSGSENPPSAGSGQGAENSSGKPGSGSGSDANQAKPGFGAGTELASKDKAKANSGADKPNAQISGTMGVDEKPVVPEKTPETKAIITTPVDNFEVMPEITVDEITESNRTITKVTVRKSEKENIYLKVIYNWGGIFYFKDNKSIPESFYIAATGKK